MLEALQYEHNAFVTLTYSDEAIPIGASSGVATLRPRDAQLWIKRFREKIAPLKVRYYLTGEYGDATERPHYHAALFNYPVCRWGRSRYSQRKTRCCDVCDTVADTWGLGHVLVGDLSLHSAAYVAGYVTKKLVVGNPALGERFPAFARMSLRPGIGGDALWDVASTILAFDLDQRGDVPAGLRHASRELPLGRYLRRRLRKLVGKDEAAPAATIDQAREALRPLWEVASGAPQGFKGASFKSLYLDATETKYTQMKVRQKIWKPNETL